MRWNAILNRTDVALHTLETILFHKEKIIEACKPHVLVDAEKLENPTYT